jgi:hypothetical protein
MPYIQLKSRLVVYKTACRANSCNAFFNKDLLKSGPSQNSYCSKSHFQKLGVRIRNKNPWRGIYVFYEERDNRTTAGKQQTIQVDFKWF